MLSGSRLKVPNNDVRADWCYAGVEPSRPEAGAGSVKPRAPSMPGGFILFRDDFAYVRFFAAIASARHPRPALAT